MEDQQAVDPLPVQAVVREEEDEGLLQRPEEGPWAEIPLAEVDERIADELTRAVVGDVTAPVGLVHLHAPAGILRRTQEEMGRIGTPTEGDHGRMAEQKQGVPSLPRDSFPVEPPLHLERLVVVDGSRLDDLDAPR